MLYLFLPSPGQARCITGGDLYHCPHLTEAETETQVIQIEETVTENNDLNEIGFDQTQLGGAKARFQNNVKAINLLYDLESEERQPTAEEQKIFANYVGWGGLAKAFDEHDESWQKEYTN